MPCLALTTAFCHATTAFGKTVVAAWLIAARKVNTLVLVHRRQLLDQWRERLAAFLNLPVKSIGQIGGGRRRPSGMIDVAVIQSLNRKQVVDDVVANYGHVIVDECHHLSAVSFEQVLRQVKARYVDGAVPISSATYAKRVRGYEAVPEGLSNVIAIAGGGSSSAAIVLLPESRSPLVSRLRPQAIKDVVVAVANLIMATGSFRILLRRTTSRAR